MSKFLKIMLPAGTGAASMLAMAYVLADQFVVDIPAPVRGTIVQPANAQEVVDDQAEPAEVVAEGETETPELAVTEEDEGDAASEMAQDSETAEAAQGDPEQGTATITAHAELTSPEGGFGLGREALPEEVAAWNIDVRPDGVGLPEGSGDVWTGEEVYVEKCAACHGDFGEAVGRWPVLAGGQDTLDREDPVKTIGSYWPYLSTVYDYVNRAMPFGEAQSLEPDEIYAITAYLLYLNNMVEDDFELSHENFTEVEMPNEGNFFMDDRESTELPLFTNEVCMSDCKDSVEITMRAAVLDVTPGDDTDDGDAVEASDEGANAEDAATEEAPAEDATVDEAATESASTEAEATAGEPESIEVAADPALIEAGEGAFRQCRACHQVGPDATNRTGPHLNGVLGRTIGGLDDFRYSNTFKEAAEAGEVWTEDAMSAFLADPRGAMPGTKMSFRGVRNEEDIAALIAYLESIEAD